MRLAGLLAVFLPASFGLTGCEDDAFLVREASPAGTPVAMTPSAVPASTKTAAGETGTKPVPAGPGQTRRYFAAIGRVLLQTHAGDDL